MIMERDLSYLIGTKQHSLLFYDNLSHPLLCDIMLENEVDLALEKWYRGKYSPSPTVPGAFEIFDTISTASYQDRWMRFTAVRLMDQSGRIIGAIETCEDFSDQKKAEDTIRASEERFKVASGIASDLIFEYSVPTKTFQWFGEVEQRLGYSQGEISDALQGWILLLHPDDKEEFESALRYHIETGEPIEDEIRIRHREGRYLTWQIKVAALYDTSRHCSSVGIVTDITLIREIEDAKRTALIAVEENIEQFAILGDHIRNPLQAIAGYNDLQGGEYGEKISVQVRIINEIIDRLDEGWIRSESIREFLRRHYGVDRGGSRDRTTRENN
jgi:PAS domain S-box-containing protein